MFRTYFTPFVNVSREIRSHKLSDILFWVFLVSIPFNLRIIYNPESAYIQGYFSYYLAYFLYFSDLLFVCFVVAFLLENSRKIDFPQIFRKISFWTIITLILLGFLASFHVKQNFGFVIYSYIKFVEMIMIFWFVRNLAKTHKFYVTTAWILYISGVFQAILAFFQFHVQHMLGLRIFGEYISSIGTGGLATLDIATGKVIRAYGTFPHPNVLAAFLIISLILGYWLVSRETSKKRQIPLILANILIILGIFVTFSRVSWLITALISLAFAWYLLTKSKNYGTILVSGVITCLIILFFWHNLLFERTSNILGSNSVQDRGTYNHTGLEIIKKTPIWGTGLGNYVYRMQSMFNMQPWEYQPPHNVFLYIWATMGVLGLGIFLFWLYGIAQNLFIGARSSLRFGLLTLAGALLVISLFDHFLVTIQQGQLMLVVSLGLIAGYKASQDDL